MNDHADDGCQDNEGAHGAAAHADARAHVVPCRPSRPRVRAGGGRHGRERVCGTTARVRDRAHVFPSNAARCPRPLAPQLARTAVREYRPA